MRFYQLRNWMNDQIALKKTIIVVWYLLSLMVETRKHSINNAVILSGLSKSQFSKYLSYHKNTTAVTLENLSEKQAKKISEKLKNLEELPWKIAIMIDATLQKRSGAKGDNVHKFNHGQGYVIGHQWTNIAVYINGILVPLKPIPFYSKKYCKENNIEYKTEHDRLDEYLNDLNLEDYIGLHSSEDVVVLADSGYDVIKIEKTILSKKWHFIIALKCRRCVKSAAKSARTRKSAGWDGVRQFFKNQRRLGWETVRIFKDSPKKKRSDYRIRHTTAFLKAVGKVQLVCSEFKKRPKCRRKYLACSDLKVQPRQIIIGYRLRWKIEIFHKHIKMHLGFEDVATKHFRSVEAHVHLVYCAYILLHMGPPGVGENAKTILEKQQCIKRIVDNQEIAKDLQLSTRIGGVEKLKDKFKNKLKSGT